MRFFLLILGNLLSLTLAIGQACWSNQPLHIVVLGSSTAAGAGASPVDSAWVWRYRSYLQEINPANQLTNLGVGGFTTYRIMPTGFIPPAGRPAPDTSQNMTRALQLQPDAIIINLPSNDVSLGYSVAEQLANFDSLVHTAELAQVPVWVATTQPKNYGGNPIPIQKQQDVRDSILARYSPFTLDFWTDLADSTSQLVSTYDSGDGTHLNNAGHGLLFSRVRDAALPDWLISPSPAPNLTLLKLAQDVFPLCGDSLSGFKLHYYNQGPTDTINWNWSYELVHLATGTTISGTGTENKLLPYCETDSLSLSLDTRLTGTYSLQLSSQQPGQADQDTLDIRFFSWGDPTPATVGDTACGPAELLLIADGMPGDSLRWYLDPLTDSVFATGDLLLLPPTDTSVIYYVQAFRGDFVNRDSLASDPITNINFNGTMLDLIADTALVLDSLALQVFTTGPQVLEFYTRPGGHIGHETDPAAWNAAGTYPVLIDSLSGRARFAPGPINLQAGDTLGIYIQLQDPGSRLSYRSMNQPRLRTDGRLQMWTGSGISHDFGGTFYPRDWNGQVYYHYGEKVSGDCQSPRLPVAAAVSQPALNLGNDTILNLDATILLEPETGFVEYIWSTGAQSSSLLLAGDSLGMGIYPIWVEGTDSLGCTAGDTIIVVFAPLVSISAPFGPAIKWGPNPNRGMLHLELEPGQWAFQLSGMDGRLIWHRSETVLTPQKSQWALPDLAKGTYTLSIRGNNGPAQSYLFLYTP